MGLIKSKMKRTGFKQKPRKPLKRSPFKKKTLEEVKARKVKKKKKGKTPAKLKKELDAVFSKFIRQKHSKNGLVTCYTCKKVFEIKRIQNGHFVSRQYLATRWDENNCRPQCWGCNGFGNGQLLDFEENLIKEIGREKVEELKQKRHEIWKLTPQWYEQKIAYYKSKLEE